MKGISLQREEKTKKPPRFYVATRDFSLQRGRSAFSVTVLTATKVFLTTTTRFCPYFAQCMHCREKESHCSECSLPSHILAYLLQRPISPLYRLSKVCPKKILNFFLFYLIFLYHYYYFLVGQTPATAHKFCAAAKVHNSFLFGCLAVVD